MGISIRLLHTADRQLRKQYKGLGAIRIAVATCAASV